MCMFATPAHALTVSCVNCSNSLLQALDRATNMEQLSTLISEYHESVTQTAQQIRMVQQNIEQYANMLQNTAQLPANLVNELKGNLTRLANLSGNLKTLRGDIVGLGQVFNSLFPEQALFEELAGASPAQVEAADAQYQQQWDKWSATVDQASQATFCKRMPGASSPILRNCFPRRTASKRRSWRGTSFPPSRCRRPGSSANSWPHRCSPT